MLFAPQSRTAMIVRLSQDQAPSRLGVFYRSLLKLLPSCETSYNRLNISNYSCPSLSMNVEPCTCCMIKRKYASSPSLSLAPARPVHAKTHTGYARYPGRLMFALQDGLAVVKDRKSRICRAAKSHTASHFCKSSNDISHREPCRSKLIITSGFYVSHAGRIRRV